MRPVPFLVAPTNKYFVLPQLMLQMIFARTAAGIGDMKKSSERRKVLCPEKEMVEVIYESRFQTTKKVP